MDTATVAATQLKFINDNTSACPLIIGQKESSWTLTIVAANCIDTEVLTPTHIT